MFRTRDFLMIFSAVVFLLVAIGTTLFMQGENTESQTAAIQFSEVTDTEYGATLDEPAILSREERVAEMRRKIAEGGELAMAAPEESEAEVVITDTDTEPVVGATVVNAIQKCPGYGAYQGNWAPQGITIETSEGARVVYRTVQAAVPMSDVPKEVLLQLPLYPIQSTPACLGSDVVGIAQDGSLIRNHEVGLYGVFGENTLIGYALDGFPIYGTSDATTDTCGGTVVAGEYHYYLSEQRETVLNCFMASPVSL